LVQLHVLIRSKQVSGVLNSERLGDFILIPVALFRHVNQNYSAKTQSLTDKFFNQIKKIIDVLIRSKQITDILKSERSEDSISDISCIFQYVGYSNNKGLQKQCEMIISYGQILSTKIKKLIVYAIICLK